MTNTVKRPLEKNYFSRFKSLVFFLIAVLFTLQLLQAQNRDNYSLLWEFKHPDGGEKGYLFGTMHLEDSSVFKFSDQLMPAIESSEVFAMEVHPDSIFKDLSKFNNDIDFRDRYKKLLGDKDYELLNNQLIKILGVPIDSLKDNSIDGIDSKIKEEILKGRNDVETFLDVYLYGVARSFKKSIAGLEKVDDQMTDYKTLKDEELLPSLRWMITAEKDDYISSLDELMQIYISGDISLLEEGLENDSEERKATMLSRNTVMTSSIDNIVKSKSLFAAVGAAHLPGENGILQLLRDKGYQVKRVDATFKTDVKNLLATKSFEYWEVYEDDSSGIRVNVPDQEIEKDQMSGMQNMKAFVDLVSGVSVFLMTMDVPKAKQGSEKELMQQLVESFSSRMDTIYNRTGVVLKKDQYFSSISGNGASGNMRFDIYTAHNKFYLLGADYNTADNSVIAANYYFESPEFYEPVVPETPMIKVTNDLGAFSVNLPDNYTFKETELDNPLDPENSKYDMFLYTAQSPKDSLFYLFRYNDFPIGYHLSSVDEHFESYRNDLLARGVVIKESERGTYKGLVTQDLLVNLGNGLPARIRILYRGNRIYLLLLQNLNKGAKILKNNSYFNSLEFEELLRPQLKEIEVDDSFSFKFPVNFKVSVESSFESEVEFQKVTDYMGRSDRTGDSYSAAVTELGDYFHLTTSKNEFLDDYMDLILSEGDSIYIKQSFTVNEIPGREYYISIKNSPITKRYRVFFSGKKIVFLATVQDRDRITGPHNDEFFNAFVEKEPISFDIYKDKADMLLKDLLSENKKTAEKAHVAIEYYEFDPVYLKKITKLSKRSYANDTTYFGTKNMLLFNIAVLQDDKSLPYMKSVFMDNNTSMMTRAAILESLPIFESKAANDLMFELASTDLINTDYEDRFVFLEAENDSLFPIADYGNKILEIQNNQYYRSETVSYFERKIQEDPDALPFLKFHKDRFTADFIKDATMILDTAQSNAAYFYRYDLNSYFSILDTLQVSNQQLLNRMEDIAYSKDNRDYTTLLAFEYLTKHQRELNEQKIIEFIEPLFYRFEGMQKLVGSDKANLIPATYVEPEEYGLLSLYNALYDEEVDTTIKFLDLYERKGQEYLIYQFNYDDEDPDNPENYLAIVTRESVNFDELEMFSVDYAYDSFKEDWRNLLEEYFKEQELNSN